ncbi:acyltransferase family protein [Salinimonas marina]|uniref:Acyltransferase family protein n=1 Tax=Salinimonas marina TaxID=2785918 RepID=A0A7S9HDQ9_9ALTE|nr:acyltransferase family protein [Salinimonas marina]QPG06424.1 acyltransferase family protein [Salinimonas marina]
MQASTPTRIHGLDTARAFLMALGAFYHAALIYSENRAWRVASSENSGLLKFIATTIHEFRMEAFFLVSGFFFVLLFDKMQRGFLGERLQRVVIPLIAFGLTLNVLMNYFSENINIDWNVVSYFLTGHWLGHLWFLGNLSVYFVVFYAFLKAFSIPNNIEKKLIIVSFFLVTPIVSLLLASPVSDFYPKQLLFITVAKLALHAPYFFMGMIMYRNKEIFLSLFSKKGIGIAVLAVLAIKLVKRELALSGVEYNITSLFDEFSKPFLIYIVLGIFMVFMNKSNKAIKSMSDASYTIYLLHQPIIVLLYSWLMYMNINLYIYTEYAVLVSVSLFLPYVIHTYIVNNFSFARLLFNGVIPKSAHYKRKLGAI